MYKVLFILLIFSFQPLFGQLHNRLIKFNIGVSSAQFGIKNEIAEFNDTSLHQFELVTTMPTISYSHEFIISNILSISGKGGFQYLNIYYDNQYYGSPFFYLSVNPAISIIYRKKFEYYIKLQLGVNYWMNKPELLEPVTRRLFPEKINAVTGVTIGGFNYYFSPKFGANLELSIWSPELVSFGLTYRFLRGELPTIQELNQY